MTSEAIAPPRRGLLFLEGRVLFELAATLSAYPFLRRAPRGDGHGWKLARNLGPSPALAVQMVERFQEIRARYGRRVTLVGWSLGGIYAREIARRFADDVRQVITLASPFRDVEATNVPRFLLEVARRRPLPDEPDYRRVLHAPLPMPTTAIYGRSDGITAWQSCRLDEGPLSQNIEVVSSHLGIGHHPVALLTIADRLAQPEGA
jgi:pimeloyl-ACP methyl ester carboxylesterase